MHMKGKFMRPFDIRNVNRTNSYEWTRCNNESKAPFWRNYVVKNYGGDFQYVQEGARMVWKWNAPTKGEAPRWIFTDPEGNIHQVSNFNGFCKQNSLDNGRMYDTYTGKRKHHKNWKATKLYGADFSEMGNKNFRKDLGPPARS